MNDDLSFKDFLSSEDASRPLLSRSDDVRSIIGEIASPFLGIAGVSESKRDQFAKEVSDVALSDSFISEISEKVGAPAPGESEDAFVRRAKTMLREALRARFRSW